MSDASHNVAESVEKIDPFEVCLLEVQKVLKLIESQALDAELRREFILKLAID
jgi:hypothetical protein